MRKYSNMVFICVLLIAICSFSLKAFAQEQIVTPVPQNQQADSNQAISIDINYSTANPEDETLNGLGIRIHWNSNRITFVNLTNVFETNLVGQGSPENDTQNFDNDPDTDRFVLVAWADTLTGSWPDEALPIRLYTANFTTAAAFNSSTVINFSASSTHPNYTFFPTSSNIEAITNQNQPPTANAGSDQTVTKGSTVTLNGSQSSDPDEGDTLTSYEWALTSPTNAAIEAELAQCNTSVPTCTFTAPAVGQDGLTLTFQLTVTDSNDSSNSDNCTVTVSNAQPFVDAGSDQTVTEETTVILDGSQSSDPDTGDTLTYEWTQRSPDSPIVSLATPNEQSTTFTAPVVGQDGLTLTFQLTVTDSSGLTSTDTCTVTVTNPTNVPPNDNAAPVANAGSDQAVMESETVTLNGSASSDADGDIDKYEWKQKSGTLVTLSNALTASPTFVAPAISSAVTLVFELTVTDNEGLQATDSVSVKISDNGIVLPDAPESAVTLKTIATVKNIALEVIGGKFIALKSVNPADISDTTNKPDSLPYDLIDMKIKTIAGATVQVIVYLPEAAPSNAEWYKYSATTGWYEYSNAEFNSERTQIILTLTDGGDGDEDGEADGIIVDPSGLGIQSHDGDNDIFCFISTSAHNAPINFNGNSVGFFIFLIVSSIIAFCFKKSQI
ncbi:exported hypothetical protein [Candidatus Magnetomoraceae bacterium gMMP-15]